MSLDKLNFDKLLSSNGKTTKSFEQLIFQLISREYADLGKFTPIDGSGGDGGIEFYLLLHSGDVWGWQCKYYENSGRLNESNRAISIEKSLKTASNKYPALTKWFLCLKTNLTTISRSGRGKFANGERGWFETILPTSVPAGRSMVLDFIGEDEIIGFLSKPKNIGIKSLFFGDLEVDINWFKQNFESHSHTARTKYDPDLHTIDDYTLSVISYATESKSFIKLIERRINFLKHFELEFSKSYSKLKNELNVADSRSIDLNIDSTLNALEHFQLRAEVVYAKLDSLADAFERYDKDQIAGFSTENLDQVNNRYLTELFKNIDVYKENRENNCCYSVRRFFNEFENFVRNYIHKPVSELNITGSWAVGKTHLAYDIAFSKIRENQPAIFITGDKFNNESNLESAILKLLAVPPSYSIMDLLNTLDTYGKITQCKIPIIIDGLNETTFDRSFSLIWSTHLHAFAQKISRTENLILITTFRESYQDKIWLNDSPTNMVHLSGFQNPEILRTVVQKYFRKYRLAADLSYVYLERFSKPLFLKIFCELKNPGASNSQETEVNIESDSNDEIFSSYFKQIERKLCATSNLVRPNEQFVTQCLDRIGKYLWDNNLREIEVNEFYEIIEPNEAYYRGQSRTEILFNEDLVIARDMRDGNEYVSITYEIMSGYVIAKHLVKHYDIAFFDSSSKFYAAVNRQGEPHPLSENILAELSILFPKYKGIKLHDIFPENKDKHIFKVSTSSLWSMEGSYVNDVDIEIINRLFQKSFANKEIIINYCLQTITDTKHPFNAYFLSQLLRQMTVSDRDLIWTESIRNDEFGLIKYLNELKTQCNQEELSHNLHKKLVLAAEYCQWFLVSTNRKVRDYTTEILFYFGRRFPVEYAEMVYRSIPCNDPYLSERMLAALYGICLETLQEGKSSQLKYLYSVGRQLFEMMFSQNAEHFTTHIMSRNYARGCVKIALLIYPKLLSKKEIKRLHPPHSTGAKMKFAVFDYGGNSTLPPINMDFSNYTIGTIVKGGGSYSDNPLKKRVRGQIYHRIFQLGWKEYLYSDAEAAISRHSISSRGNRSQIERYGKKYSWIGYYEIAGHLEDKGLIENEYQEFRLTIAADIDPCFPIEFRTKKIVQEDLLGDRSIPLLTWLNTSDVPEISNHLNTSYFNDGNNWICLDGFINQNDAEDKRRRFTFIRSFLVDAENKNGFMRLLEKQDLGGRWLPEKIVNRNTFAGEMYCFSEAVYSNYTTISFEIERELRTFKKGEEGYFPDFEFDWNSEDNLVNLIEPDQITREIGVMEDFEVLMPVMDYEWSYDIEDNNLLSRSTVLSHELVEHLNLRFSPNDFKFVDVLGEPAVRCVNFYDGLGEKNEMLYLRKDLLDKYLQDTGKKLLWAIWGERDIYTNHDLHMKFYEENNITKHFTFGNVVEY